MSAIIVQGDLVHYEVLGRGRPVILIHGWLGSWRYWVPAMSQLSTKYRTYALDLWGFGDSGKDAGHYDFASQMMLLDQFMARLGIGKAALVGHDLGAALAARFAMTWPDRVPRVMAVSPPLFRLAPGAPLIQPESPPTKRAAPDETLPGPPRATDHASDDETLPARTGEMKARIQAALEARAPSTGMSSPASETLPHPPGDERLAPPPAAQLTPVSAPSTISPPTAETEVHRPNPLRDHLDALDPLALLDKHVEAGADLDKLRAEASKADKLALARSVASFSGVDTLRDLARLAVPTLTVYGLNDSFLPPPDSEMIARLKEGRSTFHLIGMDGVRHFPMLETIDTFTRLLLDFLEAPDVTQIAIKKKWERRVR